MEEDKKQGESSEIQNISPLDEGEVTPEAEEAGFHAFPEAGKKRFSFPFGGIQFNFSGRRLGRWGVALGIVFLLFVIFGAIPAVAAYKSFKDVERAGRSFYEAVQNQNLDQMKASLEDSRKSLGAFDKTLIPLAWTRVIPFAGGYRQDAKSVAKGGIAGVEAAELILATVEPYADILGLDGGEEAGDGAKTAEERINFVVETIDEIIPKLDEISAKTTVLAQEINKIDPGRYPAHFRGKPLREPLENGIFLINQLNDFVTNGKPVLEQAPYLLGIGEGRTYLFLWQNDKELRPTGGFITAYSIIRVKDAKFTPVVSDDIYKLDGRFNSRIPAPEPIKKYLPLVPYWNLRDMNLSPDFKVSMDTFSENYRSMKSAEEFDGIIAVDTYPLVSLLQVMGQIGVPGLGNYSAEEDSRCNCPQVIYELESFADVAGPIIWAWDLGGKIIYKPPHADNRKGFLGPLMRSLIANAMGSPKDRLPGLFEAGWKGLQEKHILFYFPDEGVQAALESFNLAGRLRDYPGDYLHINDTNFAGAKSNLYVQQEVSLEVAPGKDGTTNTLAIKYSNPQEHDGWLNGPFRDWFRIYVPKGSELIDSTGSEVPVVVYEDLDKTVFEGFFTLRPEGVLELRFKYKTPVNPPAGGGDYKILIQKQPGKDAPLYRVSVDKEKQEFKLNTDRDLRF